MIPSDTLAQLALDSYAKRNRPSRTAADVLQRPRRDHDAVPNRGRRFHGRRTRSTSPPVPRGRRKRGLGDGSWPFPSSKHATLEGRSRRARSQRHRRRALSVLGRVPRRWPRSLRPDGHSWERPGLLTAAFLIAQGHRRLPGMSVAAPRWDGRLRAGFSPPCRDGIPVRQRCRPACSPASSCTPRP